MKRVRFTREAQRDLDRHANLASRVYRALDEYAGGLGAHANQVKRLVGTSTLRLRVGDFRVLFIETTDEIEVTKVAPRGEVYD